MTPQSNTSIPAELRTDRLLLRPWRAADAASLSPVLEANRDHLGPWIPRRVSEPAPISVLEQRLEGFGSAFASDREWRYGIFTLDTGETLGELSLFPRCGTGRVSLDEADRAEIGYWLRADFTGHGLVAEAARAVLAAAAAVRAFECIEIRCDARNSPSGAVAKRLGFTLSSEVPEKGTSPGESVSVLQVWTLPLSRDAASHLPPV